MAKICSPTIVARKGGLGDSPSSLIVPTVVRGGLGFAGPFWRSVGLPKWQGLWKNRARRRCAIDGFGEDTIGWLAQLRASGVLQAVGPRESPVQGILRLLFPWDQIENCRFPHRGRGLCPLRDCANF